MADSCLSAPDPFVHMTGLGKSFGRTRAVGDVSFTAERGELIGLVGANGGGKTTTLRMIAGLLRPDDGTGTILGHDIYGPRQARIAGIGYMSQRLALYPDLTVRENLMFRARAHRLAHPAAVINRNIADYGLARVADMRVGTLSGGWARRVQFAATIIHSPRLLLLDEPTAGLDIATRHDIWAWLATARRTGCAIVISTHDLNDAEQCDRVVPYHEGRGHPALTPSAFVAMRGAGSLEAAILALAQST
jgi:ABC-2 type transport system ATP-binding protein